MSPSLSITFSVLEEGLNVVSKPYPHFKEYNSGGGCEIMMSMDYLTLLFPSKGCHIWIC